MHPSFESPQARMSSTSGLPRSILKSPDLPGGGPKSRFVRFAEVDQVAEFNPSDQPPATAPPGTAAGATDAAAAAATNEKPAAQDYRNQQQSIHSGYTASNAYQYPYPGYYYHPYAYHPGYSLPPQAGASSSPVVTAPTAAPNQHTAEQSTISEIHQQHHYQPVAVPLAEAGAAHAPAVAMPTQQLQHQGMMPQYQDPKRMHLMAKSVSITVNQVGQGRGDVSASSSSTCKAIANNGTTAPASAANEVTTPAHNPETHGTALAYREVDLLKKEDDMVRYGTRWLHRSCLLRAFRAWRHLCEQRWWKVQLELRDLQLATIAAQSRHIENRPVCYMMRYRLRLFLRIWRAFSERKKAQHTALQLAERQRKLAMARNVLQAWHNTTKQEQFEAMLELGVVRKHAIRRCRTVLVAWRGLVGQREQKQAVLQHAVQVNNAVLARCVLGCWRYLARTYALEKALVQRYTQTLLQRAIVAWQQRVTEKKHDAALVNEARARHAVSLQNWAFFSWRGFIEGKQARAQKESVLQLQNEAEQLRRDNERLARVIDSADWGRDRIAELTQAGQVLQQERDALLKLVETLPGARARRGSRLSSSTVAASSTSTAAAPAPRRSSLQLTGTSFSESRRTSLLAQPVLTSRSSDATATVTVARAPPEPRAAVPVKLKQTAAAPAQPTPISASARNKLTVRAGSSFNALVRALKQDLLASGALSRDPEAAFAVDKLSTQRVELLADGTVKVQVLADTAATPGQSFRRQGDKQEQQEQQEQQQDLSAGEVGGRSVGIGKRFAEG